MPAKSSEELESFGTGPTAQQTPYILTVAVQDRPPMRTMTWRFALRLSLESSPLTLGQVAQAQLILLFRGGKELPIRFNGWLKKELSWRTKTQPTRSNLQQN